MAELKLEYRARKSDCAMTMTATIESEAARLDTSIDVMRIYFEELAALEETDASFSQEMIAELNGERFASARPLPVFDQVQQHLRRMAVA